MTVSAQVPTEKPPAAYRRTGPGVEAALALPLLALAVLSTAVAVLLTLSPLNGLPDTYCQTVLSPPAGVGCSPVISHRWHLIALALVGALAFAAMAFVAGRASERSLFSRTGAPAIALAVAGVMLGLVAATYLAIGTNNDACGSILSKVDEHGSYAPDRPALCAPSYHAAWSAAGSTGALGFVALTGATALEMAAARRRPAAD